MNTSFTIANWDPTLSSPVDRVTPSLRNLNLRVGIPSTDETCSSAILYPLGVLGVPLKTSLTIANCDPTLSSDVDRVTLFFRNLNLLVGIPSTLDICSSAIL